MKHKKPRWRTFKQAQHFVYSLELRNKKEWREYSKSGKKPKDISCCPEKIYEEYKNMKDWLGNKNKFRTFEKARKFIRNQNLKNLKDWNRYRQTKEKPNNIPKCPEQIYLGIGWKGFVDWLGCEPFFCTRKSFLEAREYVRSLNLKSTKDWLEYRKSGKRPKDIPSNPGTVYKEWKGYPDWMGYQYKPANSLDNPQHKW